MCCPLLVKCLKEGRTLGLDEKVDEEQAGKKGSQKNSQVGTFLDHQRNSVGRKGLNNRVHGEGRRGDHSGGKSASGNLDDCRKTHRNSLVRTTD